LRPDALTGLFLFASTFLVYLKTLAPGVYGFDSAELATGVFSSGIVHPPGFPLYMLIGRVFILLPIGEVAYRLNLMSAFFASCTVVLLYLVARKLIENRLLAFAGSTIFAFSVAFWQMALVTEVYTLHTALLALCLLMVLKWDSEGDVKFLALFSFIYGLSLANHTSTILFFPGFCLMIISSRHWDWKKSWIIPCMLAVLLIGLLPYAYFPIVAQSEPVLDYTDHYDVNLSSFSGIWWMASAQTYRFFAFGYGLDEMPGEFFSFGSYLWRNFLGVGVLIGILGVSWLWRRRRWLALGLLVSFAAAVIFYANYRVIDKDTMFLPAYLIWALFVAAGLKQANDWLQNARLTGWPAAISRVAGGVLLAAMLLAGVALNWRWVDMHDAHEYEEFAESILQEAEPASIIIAPWSQAAVLEYYQIVESRRPDLMLVNRSRRYTAWYYALWKDGASRENIYSQIEMNDLEFINRHISDRTIYAVEYDPVWAAHFLFLPEGNFYRLVPAESDA
jgi:hypothetical protein